MAASSNTTERSKYGLGNAFDGLRSVLPAPTASEKQVYPILHAFDALKNAPPASAFDGLGTVPPASAASGQQVYPKRRAFDDIIKASPASASTSAESSSGKEHLPYDVFINHHGGDVKHTLASSIYNSLDATGLRVFLDKDELKHGDFCPEALEEVMRSASLHIAIFSEHYAQSPYCLSELAFMLQTGIKFIPVFYHVEPSTLRWAIEAKGIYADAFSNHEMKSSYTSEQLQSWKLALHKASLYSGETINNQSDEQKVVKNVVNRVLKELKEDVAEHPMGLYEAEQDFHKIAFQSVGPIQIVGIWGMGGAGKTTLAKELFKKKCSTVDKSSFLFNLRDAARKNLLHEKQKKLLEDLDLKGKGAAFDNVYEGKEILRSRLRSVSVLIVLDDVDHTDQLHALLPARESLGHGSLIIVTTRELRVLKAWGVSAIYKIRTLNAAHAEQLFCWHAFGQPSPLLEFKDIAKKIINACHGLPLSLKVLGGQLYGESSKNYWQSQLDKLSRIVPDDIKLRLKISYDALDKEEKEMFLDIACFFIGCRSSLAIAVWDGSGWNGMQGWQRLVNKCLVELDEENLIRMHDHLRDLGKEIANQQSPYRLWSRSQIIEIHRHQEAIRIRGMVDAIGDNCYSRQGKMIIHTSQGERSLAPRSLGLKIFVGNGNFLNEEHSELSREMLWLRLNDFNRTNLPPWLSIKKLRVLELNGALNLQELWTDAADAPLQLRELIIADPLSSSFKKFPSSIGLLKQLEKIVLLGYVGKEFGIEELPEEFCDLSSLEHLELPHCTLLSSLPARFGDLRNLLHLDLCSCKALRNLPASFEQLTRLQYLDLSECKKLALQIDILENFTQLENLNLSGCFPLQELPHQIINKVFLKQLHLQDTMLRDLTSQISQLSKLEALTIGSPILKSLPDSLGELSSLKTLSIICCIQLESLPKTLGYLRSLEHLFVESPRLRYLPEGLTQLLNLQTLEISGSPLSELDFGSGSLRNLWMINLRETHVTRISISTDCCPRLKTLELIQNKYLEVIESLPTTVRTIELSGCETLRHLPGGFTQLVNLQTLKIYGCPLGKLDFGSGSLWNLRMINLSETHVTRISISADCCRRLETLQLIQFECLEVIGPLPTTVRTIELSECETLRHLPEGFTQLVDLETLKISSCPLSELDFGSGSLWNLRMINLSETHVTRISISADCCRRLETLQLIQFENLEVIGPLPTTVRTIELSECETLRHLPEGFTQLVDLESLKISGCPLSEMDFGSGSLRNLRMINLSETHVTWISISEYCCPRLETLQLIQNEHLEVIEALPTTVRNIELSECETLRHLPERFTQLVNLRTLKISGCPLSELDFGSGSLRNLRMISLSNTHVTWISISKDCCPKLETLQLIQNEYLEEIEPLPKTVRTIELSECESLE